MQGKKILSGSKYDRRINDALLQLFGWNKRFTLGIVNNSISYPWGKILSQGVKRGKNVRFLSLTLSSLWFGNETGYILVIILSLGIVLISRFVLFLIKEDMDQY